MGLLLISSGIGVMLILRSFEDKITYYVTPSEIALNYKKFSTKEVKLGGLVKNLHFDREKEEFVFDMINLNDMQMNGRQIQLDLRDETSSGSDGYQSHPSGAIIKVAYKGILPALFKEGQMAIAVGRLTSEYEFTAREVLAKHDENYRPPVPNQRL